MIRSKLDTQYCITLQQNASKRFTRVMLCRIGTTNFLNRFAADTSETTARHQELFLTLSHLEKNEKLIRRIISHVEGCEYSWCNLDISCPLLFDGSEIVSPTPERAAANVESISNTSGVVDIVDMTLLNSVVESVLQHLAGRYHDIATTHVRTMIHRLLISDDTYDKELDLIVSRVCEQDADFFRHRNTLLSRRFYRHVVDTERRCVGDGMSETNVMSSSVVDDVVKEIVEGALIRSDKFMMKSDNFDILATLLSTLCDISLETAAACAIKADEKGCDAFSYMVVLYSFLCSCEYNEPQMALKFHLSVSDFLDWLHYYFGDIDTQCNLVDTVEGTCVIMGCDVPLLLLPFLHGCAYGKGCMEQLSQCLIC